MKKRVLAIFLAVIMTAALLPATASAADSDFVIDKDGVLIKYNGPGGDVVIPDGVTSIGFMAFRSCTSLTGVTIPNSVAIIGGYAFADCTGLSSVTIPEGVTTIENGVFSGCTSLVSIDVASKNLNYCSENGVLFNKEKTELILYPGGKKGAYTVPSSVTTIANEAFRECSNLTSLNVSANVTEIGLWAFYQCTNLTDVIIGAGSIGEAAFSECDNLTNLTLGSNVTAIGREAFSYCESLTSVTIPDRVTGIGSYAFWYCDNLTSVTIGNSATYIDYCAFGTCRNLTSITIPGSVAVIWESAFTDCASLSDVYFQGTQSQWNAIEIGSSNEALTSAAIHFVTEIATATLTSGDKEVSFSYTDVGRLSVTEGEISQGEVVLVGCYDDHGRFTGVKWLDADHASAQIDPTTPNVKLFWLGSSSKPLSPSATVWGK